MGRRHGLAGAQGAREPADGGQSASLSSHFGTESRADTGPAQNDATSRWKRTGHYAEMLAEAPSESAKSGDAASGSTPPSEKPMEARCARSPPRLRPFAP
jgi:hypothetical protein